MERNHVRFRELKHYKQHFALFRGERREKIGTQHLDSTEDLEVELLDRSQVWDLMVNDQVKQALMAAPLWRFFAENQK